VRIKTTGEDSPEITALFSSTGVPTDANYTLARDESSKQMKLKAYDSTSLQQYEGSADKFSYYYIGIRDKDVLQIHPMSMFRMSSKIEVNERNDPQFGTPLTFKEQMEEIKEKFGSRKIQRSLASKRKYAIEFGEDDIEGVDTKTKEIIENTMSETTNTTTINDSIDILPQQNRDAICVEEVYDLNDIIIESERNILSQFTDQLIDQIENSFLKNLIRDTNDSEKKLIAVYIHLIITLLNLKAQDLRKADPIPTLFPEVKDFLLIRYLTTTTIKGKSKYVLSPRQKDRLLIHGIILSMILYNYRPIEMESLQKTFKIPLTQMRKIVEIIGAYIETLKNSSGVNTKSVVLRIPLNTISEKKTFKRRR